MYARYRTALPTGCLRTMADARWSVHIDDDGAGAAAGAGGEGLALRNSDNSAPATQRYA
jgi:hypothetical protein